MGRGRGGAGRGGGHASREVQVSKKLSWLLRHGAEKENLKVLKGGYVNLGEVLANPGIRSLQTNIEEIRDIVATNAKQRFSLIHASALNASTDVPEAQASTGPTEHDQEADVMPAHNSINTDPDDVPSKYLIRANQGHSIKLADTDSLLTPITLAAGNLPQVVVHGTRHDAWLKILASGGLKSMGRNHVHFATGVPESLRSSFSLTEGAADGAAAEAGNEVSSLPDVKPVPAVLSGMRNSSTILVFINLKLALEKGLKFWMSENGVVLSEGDEETGTVGLEFFERVEERGGKVLVRDGAAVAEPDLSLAIRGGRGGRGGPGGRGKEGRGGRKAGGRGRAEGSQGSTLAGPFSVYDSEA